MGEKLNPTTIEAIDAALASMQNLADEAGLHQTTLARWRTGACGVGPGSALKLARTLQRRAARLMEVAHRLGALAEQEGGDGE